MRWITKRTTTRERSRRASPRTADLQLWGDAGSDLETKKISARSARLSCLPIIRESTQQAAVNHRAGRGWLDEQNAT